MQNPPTWPEERPGERSSLREARSTRSVCLADAAVGAPGRQTSASRIAEDGYVTLNPNVDVMECIR